MAAAWGAVLIIVSLTVACGCLVSLATCVTSGTTEVVWVDEGLVWLSTFIEDFTFKMFEMFVTGTLTVLLLKCC